MYYRSNYLEKAERNKLLEKKKWIKQAFRLVDVDKYNDDNYQEEPDKEPFSTIDTNQINLLLSANKNVDALKLFLSSTPTLEKKANKKLAVKILLAVTVNQMEDAVKQLDTDSLDVLMKFIYAGFESPSEGSSQHLLAWHEKVFNSTGVGSIVRVLADKRKA